MKKSQREIYANSFADYVIEALKRTGIKQAELARRSNLTPQAISQIVGKKPHSLTGKLLLPERETVERIADALGDPVDIARRAAGYSESEAMRKRPSLDEVEEAILTLLQRKRNESGLSEAMKERLRRIAEEG